MELERHRQRKTQNREYFEMDASVEDESMDRFRATTIIVANRHAHGRNVKKNHFSLAFVEARCYLFPRSGAQARNSPTDIPSINEIIDVPEKAHA